MKKLFIDIETIPSQCAAVKVAIRNEIKPPANIKLEKSIAAWMEENADSAAEDAWLKTSFDGGRGEVVCIGWAVDDEPVQSLCRQIDEPEDHLLKSFFSMVDGEYQVIGHNVLAFDMRFLFHRAVILNTPPTLTLRQDERYNGAKCFDTMLAWAGWGNRISLKKLCLLLGIPVKSGGIDGSMIWEYMQAGKIVEVADYCREDVEAVRAIYNRMNFYRSEIADTLTP